MIDLRRNGHSPQATLPFARRWQGLPAASPWAVSCDQPYAYVEAAVRTLAREGLAAREIPPGGPPLRWARQLAEEVAGGECKAAVVFCLGPGLVACLANKVPGVRAVPVSTIAQANQAALDVGANLLAVEMPGRTFFEVRQFLRVMFVPPSCPPELAAALGEMESRANR